ncbi:LytTR family DNA-binding domain-containing protein [Siphonobacter sp. SORGH_AS_1065]|uniref:LytR/AlgR family response regulator transcription factor n=1 Tax=Siphonobacter sp. SORGH_AS_1065 TaxID=3041795 RepID=UPI002787A43E|nr:LytTR family DNA-binding domain-containing protein [Siphonobacter sp. SORGH_AS_1065]MDQ1090065.1 DNA-binding LytR/AlgR family response regulator [Siphonobacter sp. SORGH_AS_1065]
MLTTNCLIVDDEPLAHEVLLRYIADIPFLKNVGQCYLATEALTFLHTQAVDLVFLDIHMPKLNGLEFIRTLQQPPLIIITSAHEAYALESFNLEVCDYLLKPFRFDRFLKAVNRAQTQLDFRRQMAVSETKNEGMPSLESSFIYVKSDKKRVKVVLDEILYFESLGNYVKVWGPQKFLLTPRTLISFEEQLPKDSFIRIHKSFIINKKFIHYLEANMIHLSNGKALPIGKNFRHLLIEGL